MNENLKRILMGEELDIKFNYLERGFNNIESEVEDMKSYLEDLKESIDDGPERKLGELILNNSEIKNALLTAITNNEPIKLPNYLKNEILELLH